MITNETEETTFPTTTFALSMMDACLAAVRIAEIGKAFCDAGVYVCPERCNKPADHFAKLFGVSARTLLESVQFYADFGSDYGDEVYPIVEEHDEDCGKSNHFTVAKLFEGLSLLTVNGVLRLTAVETRVDAHYVGRYGETVVAMGLENDSDELAVVRLRELIRRGDTPIQSKAK